MYSRTVKFSKYLCGSLKEILSIQNQKKKKNI
jgi:hypothetical protein